MIEPFAKDPTIQGFTIYENHEKEVDIASLVLQRAQGSFCCETFDHCGRRETRCVLEEFKSGEGAATDRTYSFLDLVKSRFLKDLL